jgi:hypothetical protein
MTEQNFPLENILTISFQEWKTTPDGCKMGELAYNAIGVHVNGRGSGRVIHPIKEFAKNVPSEAEVVVDYKTTLANSNQDYVFYVVSGTAIVRKKNLKKK